MLSDLLTIVNIGLIAMNIILLLIQLQKNINIYDFYVYTCRNKPMHYLCINNVSLTAVRLNKVSYNYSNDALHNSNLDLNLYVFGIAF